jgi:hypothetical protein
MGTRFERFADVEQVPVQPETVVALLRQLHVDNASATREIEALRALLHDNIPNAALRVSMRRNGYGILLKQRFGPPPRRICAPEARVPRVRLDS